MADGAAADQQIYIYMSVRVNGVLMITVMMTIVFGRIEKNADFLFSIVVGHSSFSKMLFVILFCMKRGNIVK